MPRAPIQRARQTGIGRGRGTLRSRPFRTFGASAVLLGTLLACGVGPSRAPLGGNYQVAEAASDPPRKHAHPVASPSADTQILEHGSERAEPDAPPRVTADGGLAPNTADELRYAPFKAGDQIRADVALSFSAALESGSPELFGNDSKLRLDAKLHVDLKVIQTSPLNLDRLEVTLTLISTHTEFGGHNSDSRQDPPETYDVTLSGQTPNIHARSGAPLEPEGRAALTVLIAPLVEFHRRWVSSPTLDLKPGWSNEVPVAVPAFLAAPGDSVHVGPLALHYAGRKANGASAPFELALPVEYGTDLGKIDLDLKGSVDLTMSQARPISLELYGPLDGTGGPSESPIKIRGAAKFSATLSYL